MRQRQEQHEPVVWFVSDLGQCLESGLHAIDEVGMCEFHALGGAGGAGGVDDGGEHVAVRSGLTFQELFIAHAFA